LEGVKYIVFDEFHYYDFFQLNAFFTLLTTWKIMGYFGDHDHAVKACLLSATPNPFITKVVRDIIGLRCEIVNERTIPSTIDGINLPFLAPTTLHVHHIAGNVPFRGELFKQHVSRLIAGYLDDGKHGIVICNSIRDANELHDHYDGMFPNTCAKITGAITHEDRVKAVNSKLIFATSTVDLGFNFERVISSDRQNIDFAFIDFRSHDDFVQRIGRVGRVLGKQITTTPSECHVFFDAGIFTKCKDFFIDDDGTDKINGMKRRDVLSAFANFLPMKNYHETFFKDHGYVLATIYTNAFRKSCLSERYRNIVSEQDKITDALISEFEIMMQSIYEVTDQSRKFNLFNAIYNIVMKQKRTFPKREATFDDLTENHQWYVIRDFIRNNDYARASGDYNGHELMVSTVMEQKGISFMDANNMITTVLRERDDMKLFRGFANQYHARLRDHFTYRKVFFSNLVNQFRSSSFNLHVDVHDPRHVMGSSVFSYDMFHVMHYYEYGVDVDEKTRTVISIREKLDGYREIFFALDLRALPITKQEFDVGEEDTWFGKYRGRYIHFKGGELDPPKCDDGTITIPLQLEERLKHDVIGYIVDDDWGFLRACGLLQFRSFAIRVMFHGGHVVPYRIFFGKDAILARSLVHERRMHP